MLEISIELQRALKHKSKLRPTGGTHRALQAQPATRDVISLKQSSGGATREYKQQNGNTGSGHEEAAGQRGTAPISAQRRKPCE